MLASHSSSVSFCSLGGNRCPPSTPPPNILLWNITCVQPRLSLLPASGLSHAMLTSSWPSGIPHPSSVHLAWHLYQRPIKVKRQADGTVQKEAPRMEHTLTEVCRKVTSVLQLMISLDASSHSRSQLNAKWSYWHMKGKNSGDGGRRRKCCHITWQMCHRWTPPQSGNIFGVFCPLSWMISILIKNTNPIYVINNCGLVSDKLAVEFQSKVQTKRDSWSLYVFPKGKSLQITVI